MNYRWPTCYLLRDDFDCMCVDCPCEGFFTHCIWIVEVNRGQDKDTLE